MREVVLEVLAEQRGTGAEFLTTAQAASIANVKASTIRTWVREGCA